MATDLTKYKFNHTMLRVKDPQKSKTFYEVLGLHEIHKIVNSTFTLYFLASSASPPGTKWTDREGVIELTHNHGTENETDFKVLNGNTEPYKGFGHVCVSVDNIHAACAKLEEKGYKFQKKLTDGTMRNIAFVLDPDNYWVELISFNPIEETADIKQYNPNTYRMNHTMIRVKDIDHSLAFYQQVMGMKIKRVSKHPNGKFNLYFLGYGGAASETTDKGTADLEGLLELTWNYGTESQPDFKYHNGNDTSDEQPLKGFGHICVTVDNLDAACERLAAFEAVVNTEKGEANATSTAQKVTVKVAWQKTLTQGTMKDIAFIRDPDNYWIEIVQNEAIKSRVGW
ncbi:lactoylglutathione lyase-like protein [Mycena galericulata]|nr:lactoylglutathione lyase-like protein [Mycena galericulata]